MLMLQPERLTASHGESHTASGTPGRPRATGGAPAVTVSATVTPGPAGGRGAAVVGTGVTISIFDGM